MLILLVRISVVLIQDYLCLLKLRKAKVKGEFIMKKQLLLLSVLAVVSGSLVQASGHHHRSGATVKKMTGDGDHFYFKDGKLVHGTIYQKTAGNGEVSYYYKGSLGMHHTLIKVDGGQFYNEYYELKGSALKPYIISSSYKNNRKFYKKTYVEKDSKNGNWKPVSQ